MESWREEEEEEEKEGGGGAGADTALKTKIQCPCGEQHLNGCQYGPMISHIINIMFIASKVEQYPATPLQHLGTIVCKFYFRMAMRTLPLQGRCRAFRMELGLEPTRASQELRGSILGVFSKAAIASIFSSFAAFAASLSGKSCANFS